MLLDENKIKFKRIPGQELLETKYKLVKEGLIAKQSHKRLSTNVSSHNTYKLIRIRKSIHVAQGPSYFASAPLDQCPNLPTLTEPELISLTEPELICMTNDEIGVSLFAVEYTRTKSIVGKTPPKVIATPKKGGIGSSVARKRVETGQHGPITTRRSLESTRSQRVGTTPTKGQGKRGGGSKRMNEGKHGVQKESRSLAAIRTAKVSKAGAVSR